MATDKRLKFFATLIGKEIPENPSVVSRWLNGIIRAVEMGTFSVEFVVREDMVNPVGLLHGGVSALIIDEMIGMTVYALGREHVFVSVNLTVDFLGKAQVGEVITAKTNVVRQGNQIINVECEILDSKGGIVARGTSNMFKTNIPAGY